MAIEMTAEEKALISEYSEPQSLAEKSEQVEQVEKITKASLHAVKTIDEMYKEIENFTQDDYNKMTAYLYAFRDENHQNNPETYKSLKNKIIACGVSKKVGSKRELTKAFEGDKGKGGLEQKYPYPHDEQTASAGTPCEYEGLEKFGIDVTKINTAGYRMGMDGVIGVENRMGVDVPVKILPHPIMVTMRREDVSDRKTPEVTVDISWHIDGEWRTLKGVPKGKLADKNALAKLLADHDVAVNGRNAERLMVFLTDVDFANRSIIPRVGTTRCMGWQDDGTFAPITGDITMATFSKSDFNDIAQAIGAHGDEKVWYDGVKKLRAEPWSTRARIVMAASFASPMISKLHFSPFWIQIEGKTGSAKTVCLRLAASIYAYTTETGGYMRSMDNTDVGLELLAGFVKNLPLCLNEMQRIKDPKTLPKKVYMITEGSGRGRGNTDINLRESAKFSTIPISTGEKPLVSELDEGGANNRVVAIRVKDGDTLIENPIQFCAEVLDKSWGHAAKPWIEGIKDLDYDAIKAEVMQTVASLKAKGKSEKQAVAAGVLLVADRLAEEIIFKDGVRLTEDDIAPFLKEDTFVDDRMRAYDVMCSIISENNNNFVSDHYQPNGKVWGKFLDGGNTLLFNSTIFNEEMRKRGFDPSMYVDWAIEAGVIEDGRKYGDHRSKYRRLRINPSDKSAPTVYQIHMDTTPKGLIPDGFASANEEDNPFTEPDAEQQTMEV